MFSFISEHPGELSALAAAILWAGSLCTFRRFGEGVPASVLNLYKSIVAVVGLSILLVVLRPELPEVERDWYFLVLSGIVGLAVGDTALFLALKRLGVQASTAIQCLAPPMTACLAYLTLDEVLDGQQLGGLLVTVVAVLGVVLLGRRGKTHLSALPAGAIWGGVGLAVVSAACQALGIVLSREAFQRVDVVLGTFVRFVPTLAVLIILQLVRSGLPSPRSWFSSRRQGVILGLASFCGTFLGVLLYSLATKYTAAGVVATITHTFPVWVVPIAWLSLGERPGWSGLVFTPVAVVGVAWMLI